MPRMDLGFHIIERAFLDESLIKNAEVPSPRVGVLDLQRIAEGTLDEPPKNQPLGVVGLEALLDVCDAGIAAVMKDLHRTLHISKHYFEFQKIPVVFLVEGQLDGESAENKTLTLGYRDKYWELTPLLGHGLKPRVEQDARWWWTPYS